MILGERTEFADAVALAAAAGTAVIGDVIDTGTAQRDLGGGHVIYWYVAIDTEVDSAADGATVAFELISSAASDMSSPTVHASTGTVTEANLTAGTILQMGLPAEGLAYGRYLGMRRTIAGEAVTGGAISSGLTLDPRGSKHYPEGNS